MKRTKLTRKQKVQIQEENKRIEQSKAKFNSGIVLIVVGLIFFVFFGNMWLSRNNEITDLDLNSLEVSVNGEIEKVWRKTVGHSLKMELNEYPNKEFKVGRFGTYSVDYEDLNSQLKRDNKMKIQILEKDYKKIDQKNTIFIYGINKDETEFLKVNDYNRRRKRDRNSISMYSLIFGSIFILGYGIKLAMTNRTPADNK